MNFAAVNQSETCVTGVTHCGTRRRVGRAECAMAKKGLERHLSWGHADDAKSRKAWARAALSKQQSIGMIALPFLSVGDKIDLGVHLLLGKHGEQEVLAVDRGSPAASAGARPHA